MKLILGEIKKDGVYMTLQEFEWEKDTLQGNICRICVSHDIKELKERRQYIINNIDKMIDFRIQKLTADATSN